MVPAFFMTASAAEVEEVDTQVVDEAYWYWDYNVKWTVCTINGEQFENIFFIWTNLGQTIVDEDGNALFTHDRVDIASIFWNLGNILFYVP